MCLYVYMAKFSVLFSNVFKDIQNYKNLIILLRFSRGFTQSQFNSTRSKFIYTSKYLKTLRTIINSANKNTTTIPQLFYYLNFTAFPNPLLLHRRNRYFIFGKPRSRTTAKQIQTFPDKTMDVQ